MVKLNELLKLFVILTSVFMYMFSAVSSIAPSISVVSSQSSTSKSTESSSIEKADPAYLDIDDHMGLRSGNLSSTLQKLFLWEKKLYEEVKVCSCICYINPFSFVNVLSMKILPHLFFSHCVCVPSARMLHVV